MPANARKIPIIPPLQARQAWPSSASTAGTLPRQVRHPESQPEVPTGSIAEWLAANGPARDAAARGGAARRLTINELILAFWTRHAETHYRRADGTPTGELDNYRDSLRPLRRLYGRTPASDFSPLEAQGRPPGDDRLGPGPGHDQPAGRPDRPPLQVGRLGGTGPRRRLPGLKTVSGLPKGRTDAKETEPVQPVADEAVDAIRPHVARQVWAMIELQRLTGMRPGEVVDHADVRPGHVGRGLGLHARRATRPPTTAASARSTSAPAPRRSSGPGSGRTRRSTCSARGRRWRSSGPGSGATARRRLPVATGAGAEVGPEAARCGTHYTAKTYYHAIGYGCRRAGVPPWHPNQLRHTAATCSAEGVRPGRGAGHPRPQLAGRDGDLRRTGPGEGLCDHGRGRLTSGRVRCTTTDLAP